ncbi:MAG: HNH endonuclease [Planctomycetota bacterium]|jgi:hypothetical protein
MGERRYDKIPDGITREHILKAADDYRLGLVDHPFQQSNRYDVVIEGDCYPPLAIVGLASRYVINRVLKIEEIRPNRREGKAFKILEFHNFEIRKKGRFDFPDDASGYPEGARKTVVVNSYERNSGNRLRCIELKGTRCLVCGIDFVEVYGECGLGFIHVHHVVPVSQLGPDYKINIETDLVPVCPNCHAMLHRGSTMLTVDELRGIMRQQVE